MPRKHVFGSNPSCSGKENHILPRKKRPVRNAVEGHLVKCKLNAVLGEARQEFQKLWQVRFCGLTQERCFFIEKRTSDKRLVVNSML